jgi:hypothetical protein
MLRVFWSAFDVVVVARLGWFVLFSRRYIFDACLLGCLLDLLMVGDTGVASGRWLSDSYVCTVYTS